MTEPGRPGYPVLVLFRALLLQSLYGLSDRELEDALADRLSFKRFVGLSLEDATPDHTVLNRLRVGVKRLQKLYCATRPRALLDALAQMSVRRTKCPPYEGCL